MLSLSQRNAFLIVGGIIFIIVLSTGGFNSLLSTIGLPEEYPFVTVPGNDFTIQPSIVEMCANYAAFPEDCVSAGTSCGGSLCGYCDDGRYRVNCMDSVGGSCSSRASIGGGDGSVILKAGRSMGSKLMIKDDFKDRDVKIKFKTYYSHDDGSYQAPGETTPYYFGVWNEAQGKQQLWTGSYASGSSVIIELMKSPLNEEYYELYTNGEYVNSFNITLDPLRLYFEILGGDCFYESFIDIDYIRWKPTFGCAFGANEFLAYEPFGGNQDISLFSTRYPVKSLCMAHPAVVFKQGVGTTTSAEIYTRLARGEVLHIPSDQVWGIFYVLRNDGTLPSITCNPSEVMNINTSTCQDPSGLVTLCSQGQFDPAIGACVVQPDVRSICEYGRYDEAQNVCIYNPPIQNICSDPDATYNSNTGKCEIEAPLNHICPTGFTYNPNNNMCEAFPISTIICDPPYAYDTSIDKCSWTPESQIQCDGVYNQQTGKCVKNIPVTNSCPLGTYLVQRTDGTYLCISEPDTANVCIEGKFNPTTKKCELAPDYQYLCLKGKISADKTSCIIEFDKYQCNSGFYYNVTSSKCIQEGGIIEQPTCTSDQKYDAVQKKCVDLKIWEKPIMLYAVIGILAAVAIYFWRKRK